MDVISENKHPLAFKELVSGKDFMVAENYINKPKDDKLDFELEIIKGSVDWRIFSNLHLNSPILFQKMNLKELSC